MDIVGEYFRQNPGSREAYEWARRSIPSGCTRSALYWLPFPLCMRSGRGSRLWDVDGHERIDFNFNNTTLILGHNHPKVMEAAEGQMGRGTVLGAPTELEPRLAEELARRLEGAERVRFTPSGTEANMQAVRVARSYTGKEKIAKCEGAYHGSWDAVPVSPEHNEGIPGGVMENTLFFPFNDPEAAEELVKRCRDELAAVIVEPVQRDIPPIPGFLRALREATERYGVLLIFDEVISFRLSPGGAQKLYGVIPDITTMGKTMGGGFPVGAYASTEEVMEPLKIPEATLPDMKGPRVGFSGTFNAHPVSMAAGLAVMREMRPRVYERMADMGAAMRNGLRTVLEDEDVNAHVEGVGSFFHVIWTGVDVVDHRTAATGDRSLNAYFNLGLMNRGVFKLGHPNVSAVTTDENVELALDAARKTVRDLKPIIKERAPHLLAN
ncbi:MAG: aspartate aminotransferase family protein [Candidatus Bathyarchaeia archaeon]